MANRIRTIQLHFMVTEQERELIRDRMTQVGVNNLGAYLRKMALDGYIVKLDMPELNELLSLMRRSSNNLNQLTRRVHETGHIYDEELEQIHQRQDQLLAGTKKLLQSLSVIR